MEGVKQKMRLQLRAKLMHARLREQGLEICGALFSFLRLALEAPGVGGEPGRPPTPRNRF